MKKYIILFISLFIFFMGVINVSAKDIALKYPMNVSYIGCTSYTYTCTGGEIPSVQYYVDNDGLKISEQFFVNNNYIGFGGNGDTVRIRVQLTDYLVKGQKYSISFIMGAYEDDVNIGNYFRSTQYYGNGYSEYNKSSISHYLYSTDDFKVDFGALHIINYVFTATANTSYFNFILESVGQYNLYLPIYGYTLTAVDNAIDLSGVATQESLNSVQSTLNVMEDNIEEFNATQEETNEKLDETNKELGDINDNITNSTTDNPSSKFEEFENMLPENGVITQLITLPISLFQRVLTSVNGACASYNLGNLMGTDLILPCINISNYIGSTLWNVIDILFSGFFVLSIGKKMIKVFNNFTSMEEGDVLD